jgi:hypothetical protein
MLMVMTTTIDPVRADRSSLRFIVVAFGVAVAWVVIDGLVHLWAAVSREVVTVELRPPFEAATTTAPSGSLLDPVDVLRVEIDASELSGAAVGWLRTADVLSMASWVVLLVLAAVLLGRVARGRLFDRRFHVLLNAVCIALFCVVALPAVASLVGTNTAITDLGYGAFGEPGARPSAAASADAWIAFLAALFVSGLQVAFRGASRLARDQDGVI